MHKDIEKRRQYYREYQKANQHRLNITLWNERDADIIQMLNEQPNKTEFIVGLLRQEYAKRVADEHTSAEN
jgi:hypothetical protein